MSMIPPFIAYVGYLISAVYFSWFGVPDVTAATKKEPTALQQQNNISSPTHFDVSVMNGMPTKSRASLKQSLSPQNRKQSSINANNNINNNKPSSDSRWHMFLISLTDIAGQALQVGAIAYAGSGIFQVCYSSILVCTAVLSLVFLNKTHSRLQWISMLWITGGLFLSAVGASSNTHESMEDITHVNDRIQNKPDEGAPMFGIFLTLATTFVFGCQYIMFESFLSKAGTMSHMVVCEQMGMYGIVTVSIYLLLYTLPNWTMLVSDPIRDNGGNLIEVVALYVLFLINVAGHIITYIKILGTSGAVATGVMQALRAVGVFIFSAYMFCDRQSSQCFTFSKGVSSFNVIGGVLLFSYASELESQRSLTASASSSSSSLLLLKKSSTSSGVGDGNNNAIMSTELP